MFHFFPDGFYHLMHYRKCNSNLEAKNETKPKIEYFWFFLDGVKNVGENIMQRSIWEVAP